MTLGRLAGIVLLLPLFGAHVGAAEKPEDLAQHAALSWLKQVDGGKYRQSWAHSAKVFKGIVTQAKWEEAVAGIRKPLGKLASRKVRSREYSETLAGSPAGKYVVITFDTVFERKASAVETVTTMRDSDGVWRVSGYYVL